MQAMGNGKGRFHTGSKDYPGKLGPGNIINLQ